jgi:hypothetical protein
LSWLPNKITVPTERIKLWPYVLSLLHKGVPHPDSKSEYLSTLEE